MLIRQFGRRSQENFSKARGLACGLRFLCSSEGPLSATFLGLIHALELISDLPLKARKLVVNACNVVTQRAAQLVAAGIVGILKKMGRDGIASGRLKTGGASISGRSTVVAVAGAVYTNYKMYRDYLGEAVAEILGDDLADYVVLKEVEGDDASGIGAARVAASHSLTGEAG